MQAEIAEEELVPSILVQRLMAGESPLRVWREHRGMTIPALATAAGVPEAAVAKLDESGEQGRLSDIAAIARTLRVDFEDLVPWSQATPASP